MIVKLRTEHHLECLLIRGCRGPSESTHAKMPHCWKSHALANNLLWRYGAGLKHKNFKNHRLMIPKAKTSEMMYVAIDMHYRPGPREILSIVSTCS